MRTASKPRAAPRCATRSSAARSRSEPGTRSTTSTSRTGAGVACRQMSAILPAPATRSCSAMTVIESVSCSSRFWKSYSFTKARGKEPRWAWSRSSANAPRMPRT
ncbi:hypothetical protein ACFPRL_20280 [Pseudoclavibacter helvolus]